MMNLGGDMDMREMMTLMRNPEGIEDMLLEEHEETGIAPAAFFADVFNIMRADVARLAQEEDIDMDIEQMTPERAAEMLADLAHPKGGKGMMLEAFNREAERRDEILREQLSEEGYEQFMEAKISSLYSDGGRPDP